MTAPDTLRCACDPEGRLERVETKALVPYQRELKSLREDRYAQLAASMRRFGFVVPIFVWAAPNGEKLILDGHQRLRVLMREGWRVDGGVPVVAIQADTEREAGEKLLVIASQYGEIDRQGLYEFGEHYQLELAEFDMAALPGVDWEGFVGEFYQSPGMEPGSEDEQGALDQIAPKIVKCPHCGQEFDVRDAEG